MTGRTIRYEVVAYTKSERHVLDAFGHDYHDLLKQRPFELARDAAQKGYLQVQLYPNTKIIPWPQITSISIENVSQ